MEKPEMIEKLNIESVLNNIVELKSMYFEGGEMFNFLTTINRANDEVSHSAILAEFLNPNGTHGQGVQILKEFIAISRINIESILESAIVRTEYFCGEGNGRIDILVSFGDYECIIIENKVFASDQPKQLKRYHDWAQDIKKYKIIHLVYLTPEGSAPTNQSRDLLESTKITLLSYREHIKTLLHNCQQNPKLSHKPRIRFALNEYENTINKFLGIMNEPLKHEIIELLKKNKYYEIIPELEQAIIDFKTEIQFEFWSKIVERINNSNISNFKVEPPNIIDIVKYYQRDNKPRIIREWPLFKIENETVNLKLQIMTNFAYGLSCGEAKEVSFDELIKNALDYRFTKEEKRLNWLVWKYPSTNIEKLNFKTLNKQAIDVTKSNKIESIADEIIEVMKLLAKHYP